MAKVYEAMLLAQENAPDATKKFLTDYNFTNVASDNQGAVALPDVTATVQPQIVTNPDYDTVEMHVAVAETIAATVDDFSQSVVAVEAQPVVATVDAAVAADVVVENAEPEKAQYLPASLRAEFMQLSEIILRTATTIKLKTLLVCGLGAQDNAEFVVENLCLALAENEALRVARFDLVAPTGLSLQSPASDTFRIRIHKTEIPNLCNITSVSGAIPLSRLFAECDVSQMVTMLAQRFDYVIITADGINTSPEVAQLAAHTDGVILVAKKEHLAGEEMNNARSILREADAQILGAVVNRHREVTPMQRVA